MGKVAGECQKRAEKGVGAKMGPLCGVPQNPLDGKRLSMALQTVFASNDRQNGQANGYETLIECIPKPLPVQWGFEEQSAPTAGVPVVALRLLIIS